MERQKADKTLQQVEELQSGHELSIIRIIEPISSAISQDSNSMRTSDVSNETVEQTPASLEADLAHYKELFTKLRFTYVEQITKERTIRAIVGDPPLIVTPQENTELEKQNVAAKAELKALKLEVAALVEELEATGRELSEHYERVQLETATLRELPDKLAKLEERVAELKEAHEPGQNPMLSMPLAKTERLVDEKKTQLHELDRQLERLQSQVPTKRKELERLQSELQTLEAKRQHSTAAAKEARRRKEAALGGVEDDLEERGRWWRSSESLLTQILDVQG